MGSSGLTLDAASTCVASDCGVPWKKNWLMLDNRVGAGKATPVGSPKRSFITVFGVFARATVTSALGGKPLSSPVVGPVASGASEPGPAAKSPLAAVTSMLTGGWGTF